ncbi:MAG: GNAT family N-acetyltransferase [Solirubrobacterales bacterium]|nr:GNAT family N-acetyltransferase [Solirubrobacterales bacterium]
MSGNLGDILVTPRLRLLAATPAMIDAELEGPGRLELILEAVIPPDWPPEHHDRETLEFWRERLAEPAAAGWWLHYAVLTESEPDTLVGSVGYKGPPEDGVVEIGYSVVPSWQRRGLATEATGALIEEAWARGANVVVAHTLEHLTPSIAVLRKLGFEPIESSQRNELEFTLRRG